MLSLPSRCQPLQQPVTVVSPSVPVAIFHTEGAAARTSLGTFAFVLGLLASRSHYRKKERKVQVKSSNSDAQNATGSDDTVCLVCGRPAKGFCHHCNAYRAVNIQLAQRPPHHEASNAKPQLPDPEKPKMLDGPHLSHPGFNPQPLTTKNSKSPPLPLKMWCSSPKTSLYQQAGLKGGVGPCLEGQIQVRHKWVLGDDSHLLACKANIGTKDVKVGIGASTAGGPMGELKVGPSTFKITTGNRVTFQQEFDGPVCARDIAVKVKEQLLPPGSDLFDYDQVLTDAVAYELAAITELHKARNKNRLSMQVSAKNTERSFEDFSHEASADGKKITSSITQCNETCRAVDAEIALESGLRADLDIGGVGVWAEAGGSVSFMVFNIVVTREQTRHRHDQAIELSDPISERFDGGKRTLTEVSVDDAFTETNTSTGLAGYQGKLREDSDMMHYEKRRHQKIRNDYDPVESGRSYSKVEHQGFQTCTTDKMIKKREIKWDETNQTVSTLRSGEVRTEVHNQVQNKATSETSCQQRCEDNGFYKKTDKSMTEKTTLEQNIFENGKKTYKAEHLSKEQTTVEEADFLFAAVTTTTRSTSKQTRKTKNGKSKVSKSQKPKKVSTKVSPSEHVEKGAQAAAATTAYMTGKALAEMLKDGKTSVTPEQTAEVAGQAAIHSACHSVAEKAATHATRCRHTGNGFAGAAMSAVNQADKLFGDCDHQRAEAAAGVIKDGSYSYALSRAPDALGAKGAGGAAAAVEGVQSLLDVADKCMKGDAEAAAKAAVKGSVKTAIAYVSASLGPFGWLLSAAASAAVDSIE